MKARFAAWISRPANASGVKDATVSASKSAWARQWMLMQAEKGFVALVKANPERLEEVARLEALSSKTWNPPTLAGRWLLVRNDREAVCYEIPAR
jgi:outer membrane protein assembly factor BamB